MGNTFQRFWHESGACFFKDRKIIFQMAQQSQLVGQVPPEPSCVNLDVLLTFQKILNDLRRHKCFLKVKVLCLIIHTFAN